MTQVTPPGADAGAIAIAPTSNYTMCPGMDQWPSTRATVTRPVAAATELIAARRQKTATTRPPSARLGMPASLVSASRCQRRSNAPVSGRSQSPFLTPDQRERQYRSRWSRSALPTTSLQPRESTQGLPGQPRSCTCTARPKYSGIDGSGRARTCEGTSWGGCPPRPSCRPGHDRAAARWAIGRRREVEKKRCHP